MIAERVEWLRSAAKDMKPLGEPLRRRIRAAIKEYQKTGYGDVVPVIGNEPVMRLRVGDWRVFFHIENDALRVLRVLPRGSAYAP
jgi:mRNA-degrading endonuclease RelE of RelBE toxin-antitoxin system